MASGTVGSITWNLNETSGEMTLTGSGAIPDYSSGGTPWNSYLNKIKTVGIGAGITVIGNYAFDSCEYLTHVSMADTVTSINDYAFRYCYELKAIRLSNSLTTIGDFVFYKDDELEYIIIPASVTEIGMFSFNGCLSLTDIRFDGNQPILGNSSFALGKSSSQPTNAKVQTKGWGSDSVFTSSVKGDYTTFTYGELKPWRGLNVKVKGEWVNVS
ncbi:MAG: leucine-rich repeat domain-containing protein [Bacteroidales bacterium]|nr:leucine-rich repeat domain-containing protein [Bacteroidales bacterium]